MFEKLKKEFNYGYENVELFKKNYNENNLSSNSIYNIVQIDCNDSKKIDNVFNMEKFLPKKSGPKKITIIVPTYNRINQLKTCINSILRQTYQNYEILIVDDCSTDTTSKEINEEYNDYRIKYIKNLQNSGAGYSRKNGYNHSTGDYIIFCDDDDYYIDDTFFETIINIFNKNDNISLICSNSYIKYEKNNKYCFKPLDFKSNISAFEYLKGFMINYSKPNSTFSTVFRKEVLEKVELSNMRMVNDASIYLRSLLYNGKIFLNNNVIGVYRLHSNNITFNIKSSFLIDNLREKLNIYYQIKDNNIFDNYDLWLNKQILLTVKYFLYGTNPSKEEKENVYNWINENIKESNIIIKELKRYESKLRIKRIIKILIRRR